MNQITRPVTALMVGALAVAGAAQSGAGPQPPAIQEQNRPAPPDTQSMRPTRKVVCGMTVLTPDGHTDFTLRRFTPAPNAPTFTLRAVPAPPCESVVPQDVPGSMGLWGRKPPATPGQQTPKRPFLFQP